MRKSGSSNLDMERVITIQWTPLSTNRYFSTAFSLNRFDRRTSGSDYETNKIVVGVFLKRNEEFQNFHSFHSDYN